MAARPNQQPQLGRLTGLIVAAPDGLALEQLMAAAGAEIPRNTLLRRRQTLIAEGASRRDDWRRPFGSGPGTSICQKIRKTIAVID